jgi:hypothetical protein
LSIEKKDNAIFNTGPDGTKRTLKADSPVSMNFWGFPVSVLPHLKKYFDDFIAVSGKELKSECLLPKAADWFIQKGYTRIKALSADSEWFGVTYKEDREAAIKRLNDLTIQGVYPSPLWK